MAFDQSEGRGRFGPPQDTWQALADFAPTLLGTLFGLRPQGQGESYGPSRLMAGPEGVKQLPPSRQGEPGYDPDPGFHINLGPSTAVPMPNPYPAPGTGVRMPEYGPGDVEVDGTQFKEPEGGWYRGSAGIVDTLWREPAPGSKRALGPRSLPAYDSPGYESIARIKPYRTGNEYQQTPQAEPGPAKASRFRDPRTGKFDYWGWLDAGMANLGKGGVLFEDDTPDVNAREGILDKPAAMTAAGAPENSRMPEESRFEARGAGQGYGLGRPVAYAAQDGGDGGDAPSDGGGAGSGTSAGPEQAGTPAQPQGPGTQGAPGSGLVWDGNKMVWRPVPAQEGQQAGQGQATPPPGAASNVPAASDSNATGLPTDPELLRKFWEDVYRPKQHKVPSPSAPGDYNYPQVPDPKDPKVKELIVSIANKHGVPPELMLIKAFNESGYDQSQVSSSGAVGILQVLPSTAEKYKVNPYTLEGNIEAATQYMKKLLAQANGNPVLAEAGYFGGDSLITNGKPFGPKTMDHVKKLLPGVDDASLKSRYPGDFASNPYTFWQYMYPYRK